MRWLAVLLTMLLFLVNLATAEGNMQVVDPSVEAFLETAARVWDTVAVPPWWTEDFQRNQEIMLQRRQVLLLLEAMFLLKYADTATFDTLLHAYDLFNQGEDFGYLTYHPYINQRGWNQRIVQRWFAENPIDLTTASQIEFAPYRLTVEHHNITGVESNDIVLTVDRGEFFDHWLLDDASTPYSFAALPVHYYESRHYWSQPNGTPNSIEYQDLNADGIEELLVGTWNTYPGSGIVGSDIGSLVYAWQAGDWELVLAASSSRNPDGFDTEFPQARFENIDSDAPLEFVQNALGYDTFSCLKWRQRIYDWTGTEYQLTVDDVTFDPLGPTVGCALRFGQEAMWAHDYTVASQHFEEAVRRFSGNYADYSGNVGAVEQYAAYAQERLVIAYMLTGQTQAAVDLLAIIAEHPLNEGTLAEALLAIPTDQFDTLRVCQIAYDFFEVWSPDMPFRNYRNLPYLGWLTENVHDFTRAGQADFGGGGDRIGCDLPYLHQQIAASTQTPTPTPAPTITPTSTPPTLILTAQEYDLWRIRVAVGELQYGVLNENMNQVLEDADFVIQRIGSALAADSHEVMLARHYRALALQYLGRADEAAAEYILILEQAPNGHWSVLAEAFLADG